MTDYQRAPEGTPCSHFGRSLLIFIHVVVCCVSLICVAQYTAAYFPPAFHIFFDPPRWYSAAGVAAIFGLAAIFFVPAGFSFGYFSSFYFYTMILGYLWLNCFTDLRYDHRIAALSAGVAAVCFMLPALFVKAPLRQIVVLTVTSFDRLLLAILVLGVTTAAIGACYNFQLVGLSRMHEYRAKLDAPAAVNYAVTMFSSALLPFSLAGFVARRAYLQALTVLILLLILYPITLNKTVLFAPFWLVSLLILSKRFEARTAVILSLLLPILVGLISIAVLGVRAAPLFAIINFRMIAIPSVAIDVYNDFFARHELTYFCQISLLKRIVHCPYQDPLSVVMQETYKLGYFNASLFATEGIASLGSRLAPVSALVCGLVIALGNRLSAGLPPTFLLTSSGILPLILLNVPLTTALLTHGAGLLFLLWYVTPRTIFGHKMTATYATPGYEKVRSIKLDPIQLSDLQPVACDELVRVGNMNDGGYVVPRVAIDAAAALLSFGLSHDWTFERDFKRRNPHSTIHCYDHTVSTLTALQYSIGQLLRAVLFLRWVPLSKAFTWIDYRLFFRSSAIHFKQKIWADNQDGSATIEDVFSRLPLGCPVFVKMDIEGSEYSVCDELLKHSQDILAMAIEFHDLDDDANPFNSMINNIKRDFYIVHIHGNNLGGKTRFNFPAALEITFLSKRFFLSTPAPSELKYPIRDLDRPNHPRFPDFSFEF